MHKSAFVRLLTSEFSISRLELSESAAEGGLVVICVATGERYRRTDAAADGLFDVVETG